MEIGTAIIAALGRVVVFVSAPSTNVKDVFDGEAVAAGDVRLSAA